MKMPNLVAIGSLLAVVSTVVAAKTALDADRDLAEAVRSEGQWTAFRRFAAPGAIIFERGAQDAATYLQGRSDPREPLTWSVHQSVTSCDGTTTIAMGRVQREEGKTGILLLVWRKQDDGSWKWAVWRGAAGAASTQGPPLTLRASCTGKPIAVIRQRADGPSGQVASPDRTLIWYWKTDRLGAVTYQTETWDGTEYRTVGGGDTVPVLRR